MRTILSLLSLFGSLAAYAGPNSCTLPSDQGLGSLRGSWSQLPVHLVLDRDFYGSSEGLDAQAIERAAATWNRWAAGKGLVAFVIDQEGEGMDIPELTDCSSSSYTEAVRGAVGIWKISDSGYHRNYRESCGTNADGSPGKLLPAGDPAQTDWLLEAGKISNASVLLNFSDYNTPGKQSLDVESLALHELGHVLGLLHSCNGSNGDTIDSTTAPACFQDGSLAVPAAYADAVMFPFLEEGQLKRGLGQNDVDRLNCLY